jgi:Acyltransferase family.
MIFNNYGESWYIHSQNSLLATLFLVGVYPWWMSALFTLAGISTVYALKKRTAKQYVKERFFKLFIPLLSAIVLLIPIQTYLADKFLHNYKGSYFEHLSIFFTLTDWSGYDGHFTPAHTWFMLYLFVISMASLPLMIWYKNKEMKLDGSRITMAKILPMFLVILLLTPILEIGGKSVGEFAACFLLGYFVLSVEEVQDRLEKHRIPLGSAWIILIIIRCWMYQMGMYSGLIWDVEERILSWVGILAIIALGKHFLEFNNAFTKYFAPAAFPIYFFHQTIVVIVAYIIVGHVHGTLIQYVSIMGIAFVLTVFMYEICRRIAVTRFLFGIKKSGTDNINRVHTENKNA